MNTDSFLAFYGEAKIKHLNRSQKDLDRLMALAERPVTKNSMREFCELAVEPWRLHFPYKPDDMPPPQGDPQAMRRVWADPDIEIVSIDEDRIPAEEDPWD